jgi:2,4-dichlorophenol 6-monooxygenase
MNHYHDYPLVPGRAEMTGGPAAFETPVLIVGGGGAGLTASILLGELGVESLLVERHPGTSLVPKAHIIHCRTLEILQQSGLEDEVRRLGCPPENFTHTTWYTSLGGEEPWDRQLLMSIPSWSYDALAPYYAKLTASPMTNLPQHLLEPALRARAEELNGADRVRFFTELTGFEQDEDGVTATILDRETGETSTVRAQYMIGADGGKTIGQMLGVEMVGPDPFVDVISLIFDADVSEYLEEDHSLIRLFLQPNPDGTVGRFSIVASGPDPWDRHCKHWRSGVIQPAGPNGEISTYTEEDAIRDLRDLFKLPDLEITNVTMNHWLITSVVSDRWQVGRTFLAGDAAHRHSPMGGLGLNTGMQDVHNLAWKLAAVIKGQASPALLETYEVERKPVAQTRVDFATFCFYNHLSVSGGFGMLPGASEEHNRDVLARLFSDTFDGEVRRAQLREMIYTLRREFQHADLDLGYDYARSPAVVADGTPPPAHDPVGTEYAPVARPGHRLPHAWLVRDGSRVATHHLVTSGRFLLLAGADGAVWCEAAPALAAEAGIPLDALRVAPDGDLIDADGDWAELRGHDEGGAVLVRPDGHVAFRAAAVGPDPEAELRTALATALCRISTGAPVLVVE